jgi:hypothetical protein
MAKELRCRDLGIECNQVIRARTQEELSTRWMRACSSSSRPRSTRSRLPDGPARSGECYGWPPAGLPGGRLLPGQAHGVGWAQRSTNARATASTTKTRTTFLIAPSLAGSGDGWATAKSYPHTSNSASRRGQRRLLLAITPCFT